MTRFALLPGHDTGDKALHIPRVGGDLDQTAIGITTIDRDQHAAGALLFYRAFLDRYAVIVQMRDHLFRRARCEKAQIVAACGFMVRGEPLDLIGISWPHVDFLVAKDQRRPRRLAVAWIEHLYLHAKYLVVPLGGTRDIADIDNEMIERACFN
jgi:hypothetical protein